MFMVMQGVKNIKAQIIMNTEQHKYRMKLVPILLKTFEIALSLLIQEQQTVNAGPWSMRQVNKSIQCIN